MADPRLTLDALTAIGVNCGFGSVGAIAWLLFVHIHRNQPLDLKRFGILLFLGGFVGQVIAGFLPAEFDYRESTLMLAGFSVYSILKLLEQFGAQDILRKIGLMPPAGRGDQPPPNP